MFETGDGVVEGVWLMANGLVGVDVGKTGAYLGVDLFACQYGGITPECDADLEEAKVLIRELGYTKTGKAWIEDGQVTMELL